ncbi:hypothetical protein RchiOBHm_Chr1g0369801 [Rosa chinensis]|uniref:Uncharacterized protein n=1 Tax=Rosa chinensis TaxID=74649 RepID=A0A2P6SL58_ROSCH|nr:hypothetical protein RchiOBHm_Chr1g0369801 [Rosa chinensis]
MASSSSVSLRRCFCAYSPERELRIDPVEMERSGRGGADFQELLRRSSGAFVWF